MSSTALLRASIVNSKAHMPTTPFLPWSTPTQAASKESIDWYSCRLLIPCQMISNDRLELLSKIRTPKLREWGTNCLGQIPYFLFYPSSGTAGSMPQPFLIRVRCHGPPRGFNVMTRSKGLPRVPLQQPKQLGFYVCYDPSHRRPNR